MSATGGGRTSSTVLDGPGSAEAFGSPADPLSRVTSRGDAADAGAPRSRTASLDGLRAVAVTAVVLFHAGVSWVPGGLLGVDVFFVLSGFLITSLLLNEHQRNGRISLGAFWTRRVRRLLPAALLLIVVTGALWRFTSPDTWNSLRGDALSTLAYVANWHFAFTGQSYFDHYKPASPLLHMWSLAVEEQFYLVWPLVVVLVLRRRIAAVGRRHLLWVCLVGIAASSGLCALLYSLGVDTSRIYYGTDTRCTALLAGAALACLRPLASGAGEPGTARHRRMPVSARVVVQLLGLAGIGALGWALATVDGDGPLLYDGGFLAVALAVAVIVHAVVIVPRGPLSLLLSWRPLVGLGRISYGVYLWHWPVLLFLTAQRVGFAGVGLFALRIGVTLLAALLSWRLLERPILSRALRLPRPGVLVPALVLALAAGVLAVPLPPTAAEAPTPDLNALQQLSNSVPPPPPPTSKVATRPARILVVGDSVALTLGTGLDQVAKEENVVFADRGWVGCGITSGDPIRFEGKLGNSSPDCAYWQQHWAQDTARVKPDVVAIMVGRWELVDRYYQGRMRAVGDPVYDAYLRQQLQSGINLLRARGAKVAVLTEPCGAAHETANGSRASEDDPARWRAFNALVTSTANSYPRDAVRLFDVASQFCPGGTYRTTDPQGEVIRTDDGIHITKAGGVFAGRILLPQLVEFAREPAPR